MASKKKAAAAPKSAHTAASKKRQSKKAQSEEQDTKALQKGTDEPPAGDAALKQAKVDEGLIKEHEQRVDAVMALRAEHNAGVREVEGQHLLTMTSGEKQEVEKFLTELRRDKTK